MKSSLNKLFSELETPESLLKEAKDLHKSLESAPLSVDTICDKWQNPTSIIFPAFLSPRYLEQDEFDKAYELLNLLFGLGEEDEDSGWGGVLFERLVKNRSISTNIAKSKLDRFAKIFNELNPQAEITARLSIADEKIAEYEARIKALEAENIKLKKTGSTQTNPANSNPTNSKSLDSTPS